MNSYPVDGEHDDEPSERPAVDRVAGVLPAGRGGALLPLRQQPQLQLQLQQNEGEKLYHQQQPGSSTPASAVPGCRAGHSHIAAIHR